MARSLAPCRAPRQPWPPISPINSYPLPDSARPWVYCFWLEGNVTREGITADLEAMRRAGIGGLLFMDGAMGNPVGPHRFMSDSWRAMFKHMVAEVKSPERMEALVYLLKIALTAYRLVQRLYRQAVSDDAPIAEKRLTTENILRAFQICPLVKEAITLGCVVHPLQLTRRQRRILALLHFPTPAQTLARHLHGAGTSTGPCGSPYGLFRTFRTSTSSTVVSFELTASSWLSGENFGAISVSSFCGNRMQVLRMSNLLQIRQRPF